MGSDNCICILHLNHPTGASSYLKCLVPFDEIQYVAREVLFRHLTYKLQRVMADCSERMDKLTARGIRGVLRLEGLGAMG